MSDLNSKAEMQIINNSHHLLYIQHTQMKNSETLLQCSIRVNHRYGEDLTKKHVWTMDEEIKRKDGAN